MGLSMILKSYSGFKSIKGYSRKNARYTSKKNSKLNRRKLRRLYSLIREQGLKSAAKEGGKATLRGVKKVTLGSMKFVATGGIVGAALKGAGLDIKDVIDERNENEVETREMLELLLTAREAEADIVEELQTQYREYIGGNLEGIDTSNRVNHEDTFRVYVSDRLNKALEPEIEQEETHRIVATKINTRVIPKSDNEKITEVVEAVAEEVEEKRKLTMAEAYTLDQGVVEELHRMYGVRDENDDKKGYTFDEVVTAKRNVSNIREREGAETTEPSVDDEIERIKVDRDALTQEVIEDLRDSQENKSGIYTAEEIAKSIQETMEKSDDIRKGRVNNDLIEDRIQQLKAVNERAKALAKIDPSVEPRNPQDGQNGQEETKEIINISTLINKLKDVSRYRS